MKMTFQHSPITTRSGRAPRRVLGLMLCLTGCAGVALAAPASPACKPRLLEGEVRQGRAWQQALSPALTLKLEAVPAGWIVRVLPSRGRRPPHDAAELANPPYRSPSPILISTDFAFRAQDAVAWNPRRFRFFTTPRQTAQAEVPYQASLRDPGHPAAGAAIFPLLAAAPEATLTILDAVISEGTADQSAAARTVATHYDQTAHVSSTRLPPTPLGALLALRFRVAVPALGSGCRQDSLQ